MIVSKKNLFENKVIHNYINYVEMQDVLSQLTRISLILYLFILVVDELTSSMKDEVAWYIIYVDDTNVLIDDDSSNKDRQNLEVRTMDKHESKVFRLRMYRVFDLQVWLT